jgi:phytoene desaturase
MTTQNRFDAIVVGAGAGGLAAAITLAATGKRVVVVEALDQPGGKAGTRIIDGVEVDTGPSVLTLPHVFQDLIAMSGLDPSRELTLRRTSPSFRYLYPDGTRVDIHHELEDTLESVEATLGNEAARELNDFLRYAAGIWDAAAPVFVFGPAPNVSGILGRGLSALGAVARIDPFSDMASAIDKRVRSPYLRMLLKRYATYNGSDVRAAPATLNCIAHVELALGGWGVEGGIGALVRALVRAAAELGVVFRYRSPVRRLLLEGGVVSGIATDEGVFLAPTVVMNADVAHVVTDLIPAGTRHGIRRSDRPSMSGYNAIFRARRSARAPHTVLFPRDYDAEFVDIFDRDRPPADPTVYLCAQEACHGRRGWSDHEPLFVMANAPPEPEGRSRPDAVWHELRDVVRQRLLEARLIENHDEMVWERTPADLARLFPGSRGAIYGASSNGMTAAFQRPDNVVAKVPGLFLASGSAHPGGGLPLAAQSGCEAAKAALAATDEEAA